MGFFVYTKIMFKCSDQMWDRVRAYKRDRHLENLNDAVTELLTAGLDMYEKTQESVVYSKLDVKA